MLLSYRSSVGGFFALMFGLSLFLISKIFNVDRGSVTRALRVCDSASAPAVSLSCEDHTRHDQFVEQTPPISNGSSGGFARQVPAAEVLSRPPPEHLGTMPKMLHSSWMTEKLPPKFEHWSMTCRRLHPDWEWVLWTDADNLQLVQMHFPWLLETYHGLPAEIYRADLARNLYMYIFGGVYFDLDVECLLPSEVLFDQYKVSHSSLPSPSSAKDAQSAFIGRMGIDIAFPHSIPNAWMASTPRHPFFLLPLRDVHEKAQSANGWSSEPTAEELTGPVALRDALSRYESGKVLHGREVILPGLRDGVELRVQDAADREHRVILLDSRWIYPYSWWTDGASVRDTCSVLSQGFNAKRCKEVLKVREQGSLTITYWSHSHTTKGMHEENVKMLQDDVTTENGGKG